ncbi:MAG: PAS domain S-box protein [Anaerolineales bacterium]|nr:PAS domain S-box protein [Anaerolineales bacterium]
MNREEILYLVPYLFSLALSLGIFAFTWQHRSVRGARIYSWFVAGQTLTIMGFIFELVSPNLQTKILWDKFQWITDIFLVILPFLIFSVQFSEHKLQRPVLVSSFLGVLILGFSALLITDDIHHLLYPNPHLSADTPFPELIYDFTPTVYGFVLVYLYGANIYGISLLARRALAPHNSHRFQYWTLVAGFLIPLFFTIFSLTGVRITPQRDIAPFSLAIGNLIVAWGLFRYKLFDLAPIARDRVLENMGDSVIVLDTSNRVVDLNQIALANIGRKRTEVIGRQAQEAIGNWFELADEFNAVQDGTVEIPGKVHGEDRTYTLNITSIHDQRNKVLGRIFLIHDITIRKQLENAYRQLSEELELRVHQRTEALRETTERYLALFEQNHDAIFILDFEGNYLDVNQRAADLLGYTRDEFIGLSIQDTSAEIEQSRQILRRLLAGEHIPLYERVFRKKDGKHIQVEINIELVRDRHGKPQHVQSVVRDITDRKRTEEALRRSAERYRTVIENQTEFIVRWRPDGIRTFVNEAYCRYFGITIEQALSNSFVQLVADEDRHTVAEKMLRLTSGVTDTETDIHRVIKPDGSIGWQEWTDHAIRNERGEIVEFQSVGRDITEKIRAEEMLRIQGAALEAVANAIIITDRDGIIQWANPAFTTLTGYTAEEVIGKNPRELVRSGKQDRVFYKNMWDTILAGEIWRGELINRRKDGTRYVEEMTLTPLRDKQGQIVRFIAIKHDISERKRAETALEKSENKHRLLFEAANDSIFLMKDGIFIDCNSKTLDMFACQREEIIGKSPIDFSPETQPDGKRSSDKAAEKINAARQGTPQFFEWEHCRLDRTPFYAEVNLSLLELEDETLLQAIVRDITARKVAEESLINEFNFNELLMRLLARFATCTYDEVDASIDIALEDISNFLDGDFAHILLLSADRTSWESYRHWTSLELDPLKRPLRNIKAGSLVWSENKIRNGEPIKINTLDDYPPLAEAERQLGKEEGIKSLLSIPIRGRDESIFGVVDIVSYTQPVKWADSDVTHLKLIGDAIANLLERRRAEANLAEAYDTTLEGWAKALELRDKETEGHSRRVTETTIAIARSMGIPEAEVEHIRRGAILHDIGKMGIPDDILRKNGPLTQEEGDIVEKHPTTAYDLLKPISFLERALDIPFSHHEKWNGSGYPRGLKGAEIPLAARIFAIADVWDALSTDRPYRNAWSREKVTEYILRESGKHFDPQVVEVFLDLAEKGEI